MSELKNKYGESSAVLELGKRRYELTDHLGNVLSVVSDRKVPFIDRGVVSYYIPEVISYTDYDPFGYPIPTRSLNMSKYRYGFNGQEGDDEVYGQKQSYTAEFWQYDSRLGRRWNVDPVTKPYESGYATFANNPILNSDPDGEAPIDRARRYAKRNKLENTQISLGNEKSIWLQYTKKGTGAQVFAKQFKENIFERGMRKFVEFTWKFRKTPEAVERKNTKHGGIWGITKEPNAYPPGQDEQTNSDVKQVDLDPLQSGPMVPLPPPGENMGKSSSLNKKSDADVNSGDTNDDVENSSPSIEGVFKVKFKDPTKVGYIGVDIPYTDSDDSTKKRSKIEKDPNTKTFEIIK